MLPELARPAPYPRELLAQPLRVRARLVPLEGVLRLGHLRLDQLRRQLLELGARGGAARTGAASAAAAASSLLCPLRAADGVLERGAQLLDLLLVLRCTLLRRCRQVLCTLLRLGSLARRTSRLGAQQRQLLLCRGCGSGGGGLGGHVDGGRASGGTHLARRLLQELAHLSRLGLRRRLARLRRGQVRLHLGERHRVLALEPLELRAQLLGLRELGGQLRLALGCELLGGTCLVPRSPRLLARIVRVGARSARCLPRTRELLCIGSRAPTATTPGLLPCC